MKIGEAAQATELSIKTIRYYADIDLVRPAGRTESGYRDYDSDALTQLRLVRRARSFGFSIDECRTLLSLFKDEGRASADVKALAARKYQDLIAQMKELEMLKVQLQSMMDMCAGNHKAECGILEALTKKA